MSGTMNTASPGRSSVLGHESKCAHTPGPWFARDDRAWSTGMVLVGANSDESGAPTDVPERNGGKFVAQVIGPDREANARLIAAAPDMLDALRACVEAEERRRGSLTTGSPAANYADSRLKKLRAAIAKATGGA